MIKTQPKVTSGKSAPSKAESKAETTDRVFREIQEKEEATLRRKTAKLRAARLKTQAKGH